LPRGAINLADPAEHRGAARAGVEPGPGGATRAGDGSVALVLDMEGLLAQRPSGNCAALLAEAAQSPSRLFKGALCRFSATPRPLTLVLGSASVVTD